MTRQLLVVCTANVCRSPSVERLFRRRLDGATDIDEERWIVSSAGTHDLEVRVDRSTVEAGAAIGIDLSDHQRRVVTPDMVSTEAADLIIGMTREHVRAIAGLDPTAWPRTFTLKELARRAMGIEPATPGENYHGWLRRVADGRKASEMLVDDGTDDITDPFGLPRRHHESMMSEVDALVEEIVRAGPWIAIPRQE